MGSFIAAIFYITLGLLGFFVTFSLVVAFLIPTWIISMPFTGLIYLCKGTTVIRRKMMISKADDVL